MPIVLTESEKADSLKNRLSHEAGRWEPHHIVEFLTIEAELAKKEPLKTTVEHLFQEIQKACKQEFFNYFSSREQKNLSTIGEKLLAALIYAKKNPKDFDLSEAAKEAMALTIAAAKPIKDDMDDPDDQKGQRYFQPYNENEQQSSDNASSESVAATAAAASAAPTDAPLEGAKPTSDHSSAPLAGRRSSTVFHDPKPHSAAVTAASAAPADDAAAAATSAPQDEGAPRRKVVKKVIKKVRRAPQPGNPEAETTAAAAAAAASAEPASPQRPKTQAQLRAETMAIFQALQAARRDSEATEAALKASIDKVESDTLNNNPEIEKLITSCTTRINTMKPQF